MALDSLPQQLQPLIQDHYLHRFFEDSLHSKLGFRAIADREPVAIGIGETVTKTRTGLLVPVLTPLDAAANQASTTG